MSPVTSVEPTSGKVTPTSAVGIMHAAGMLTALHSLQNAWSQWFPGLFLDRSDSGGQAASWSPTWGLGWQALPQEPILIPP